MSGRSRTLTIEILGDGKQASAAFDGVAQSADGFGSKLGSIAKVGAVAVASVGAAAVGLGVVAYKMGEQFDEAYDTIRVGTGATGDALEGLQDSFQNVVSSVPTDFNTASTAIADLNTRLGLTGKPLEDMATQFINLSRVTGEDLPTSIANGTRVFGDWSIATEDQGAALDHLFKVSQSTGIGVNDLMTKVVQFGAPLRQMGFGFEESSALMGKWEKEGVNAELVASSLRIALGKMANEGVTDTNAALTELQERIKNAGSEGEATAIAMDAFGAKAGPDMAAAIREGRFEVEDLMKSLEESGETINGVAGDTDDLGQKWTLLKNKAMVAFEPITSGIFNLAGSMMDKLLPVADKVLPAMVSGLQDIGAAFQEGGLSGALSEIGSKAADAFNAVDWGSIASTVVGALGDGLGAVAGFGERVAGWAAEQFAAVDWSGLGSTLIDGLLAGLEAATDFGSRAVGWISGQFEAVDWTGLGTSLVNGLIAGLEAAVDFGSRAVSWISGQFAAVDWSGLGTALVDGLLAGLMAVADFGSRAASWIAEQFTSVDWSGLGTTLVDGLMTGLSAVTDFGSRAAEWISGQFSSVDWAGVGESISSGLSSALSSGTAIAEGVASQFQSFDWSGVAESIKGGLSSAGDSLGGMFDFSGIQSSIEGLMPVIEPFVAMLRDNLGETISNLQEALAGLTPLWAQLQELFVTLLPAIQPVAAILGGVLLAGLASTLLAVSNLAVLISEGLIVAIDIATASITTFTGIIETISAIVGGVIDIVRNLLEGDFAGAWQAAQEMVGGVVDGIGTMLSGLPALATTYVLELANLAVGFLTDLVSDGAAKAGELVEGILTALGRLLAEAPGHLSGFVESALGFLGNLAVEGAAKAGDFVTGVLNALITLFVDGPGRIYDFVVAGVTEIAKLATRGAEEAGKLPGAVLGAIGDLSSTLYNAGTQLVQGLLNGMGSLLESVRSKASEIANAAKNAVTGALGIQSPSTVMHEYGVQTAQGFIDGMESRLGEIFTASSGVADAVIEGATKDLDRVPELVGSMTDEVALTVASTRDDIQGQLDLATLAGEDEEVLQKYRDQLAAIDALLLAWAEATGQTVDGVYQSVHETVQAALDAVASDEAAEAALKRYETFLGDLDSLASGETATKLGEDLAEMLNLQRIAEQAGDTDLAAFYAAQVESINADLVMVGELMATPIVQGMTDTFKAEEIAAEWDKRLTDALSGPEFGEGIQASINGLQEKIDLAPLLDVPQSVVDGWEAEKVELQSQSEQYWRDIARAAANGLIDKKTLAEYAKAGGAQFEAYLGEILSPEGAKQLINGVAKMSKDSIDELKKIFSESPEIAADFIDDLVLGVKDGSIELADAMELLAMIPEEELTPALIDLKDTWTKQLAEAVVSGNTEMAESLRALIAWVEEFDASVQGANESVSKMNGNSYGWKSGGDGPAGLPSSGGSFGSGSGGGSGSGAGGAGMSDAQLAYYQDRSPGYQRWKALAGNEQIDPMAGREVTVVNNNTINIDGEPVAESVNKVNSRNLPTMMGPI